MFYKNMSLRKRTELALLQMSPSSARHHIKKLEEIGIIEFDHHEQINGITARYLRVTDKTISIGQELDDAFSSERDLLARNILSEVYYGFHDLINEKRQLISEERKKGNRLLDQLAGVVHLPEEEANELFQMIHDYIKEHAKATENSHPYEYVLIAYRADLKDDDREEQA